VYFRGEPEVAHVINVMNSAETSRGRMRSNEIKMSYRYRERARFEVKVIQSSKMWTYAG
jgi:hypothetical protein